MIIVYIHVVLHIRVCGKTYEEVHENENFLEHQEKSGCGCAAWTKNSLN